MSKRESGSAYFSDDGRYRYALSRCWDASKPMMLFVGLNPSTADELRLDPTLRRVVHFAEDYGCGGMWVGNLFAFRATNPIDMKASFDPVGPDNDRWLKDMAKWCRDNIYVGWGTHGGWIDRDAEVCKLLDGYELKCWRYTKDRHPGHPLYLPRDTKPFVFQHALTDRRVHDVHS